jgi:GcrA cell cycle regulator
MGGNGVVSIRVEALGVSITIADSSIAIQQTRTDIPAAVPNVKRPAGASRQATEPPGGSVQASLTNGAVPASAVVMERVPPLSECVDDSMVGEDSGKSREAQCGQTKPVWSDEEVEKFTALWPTHSSGAIARQLGRSRSAVRSKVQNLGLKKAAPPTVTSPREAKSVPKPRPLSAA